MDFKGGPRKALASRLAEILAAARAVLEAGEYASRYQGDLAAAAHQEAARALTGRIRGLSTVLAAAADELGQPETSLTAHALERISRMTEPEAS